MLNDILTGKSSTEPAGGAHGPYRAPGAVPPESRVCTACGQTYPAVAGAAPGPCPTCAMAAASAAYAARMPGRPTRDARIMRWGVTIALAVGAAIIRYGWRASARDDAAQAAGYHTYAEYEAEQRAAEPTDPYSQRVRDLAETMCGCSDLACARDVEAQYARLLQTESPVNDDARESAAQDGARLVDCQARLEAGGV